MWFLKIVSSMYEKVSCVWQNDFSKYVHLKPKETKVFESSRNWIFQFIKVKTYQFQRHNILDVMCTSHNSARYCNRSTQEWPYVGQKTNFSLPLLITVNDQYTALFLQFGSNCQLSSIKFNIAKCSRPPPLPPIPDHETRRTQAQLVQRPS